MRVAILDIEPIEPAEGGSRQRLKGLYHALGTDIDATYVGAWHWRGPSFRRLRHSPTLEEITIPFSDAHFDAVESLERSIGGAGVVDASFPRFAELSTEYCRHARAVAAKADIVVISHPWTYAVIRVGPRPRFLVYDAHNLEGDLRRQLLGDTQGGRDLAEEAERLEADLCNAADLILVCSRGDQMAFVRRYGIPLAKVRVAPNGVFADAIAPATVTARRQARRDLRLGRQPVALFVGGLFPPNLEAATFIRDRVAPACRGVSFVVLGAVGEPLRTNRIPRNVRILGKVDDAAKRAWLAAADIGINPMFSGAGTNIKVLEYMAAGLPVVTTAFGARGIDEQGTACIVSEAPDFADRLRELAGDRAARERLGGLGRLRIEREYDWAHISPDTAALVSYRVRFAGLPAPAFSVVIPTLDRHACLRRLFDLLAVQRERDFEVIAVDQTEARFRGDLAEFGLTGVILRTPVRGSARARNLGAAAARGRVLAFIDDDCQPAEDWISTARARFAANPSLAGIEGRTYSDRVHDSAWRSVHNYGAEGVGYMTCNLFARAEAFHRTGGFDPIFDGHQFREDTDFGWRLEAQGRVAFADEVLVYHPPWIRTIPRESSSSRAALFASDPLLLRKHPERYHETFMREGHWLKGPEFWDSFLSGAARHGVVLPKYVERLRDRHARRTR